MVVDSYCNARNTGDRLRGCLRGGLDTVQPHQPGRGAARVMLGIAWLLSVILSVIEALLRGENPWKQRRN